MRLLIDECSGPVFGRWLQEKKDDVFSVYEQTRRIGDNKLVEKRGSNGYPNPRQPD